MSAFKRSKKDIIFSINAVDNARTRASNNALIYSWVVVVGLMVVYMVITLLIGA